MGVSIHIHQERRGHEMGSLLSLFIQHEAVGISDQWSIVCVEEHLVWKLWWDQERGWIRHHAALDVLTRTHFGFYLAAWMNHLYKHLKYIFRLILAFSYGLELPKPKMSRWPWESVQAKRWPSGVNLQSNTAPWPWPSIWMRNTNSAQVQKHKGGKLYAQRSFSTGAQINL